MEGAALNTVENAGLPTVQLILQENSMDRNKKPITELGVTTDSGCHCVQGRLDDGSGAGAIAGSRADMRLVTTNSLSELVWSPHKGLRVKCANCSIGDVMLPPSQSCTIRETNNEDMAVDKEGPSSSQTALRFDCQVSDKVNLVRSSSDPTGIRSICKTISLEEILGLSRDMEVLTKKMEQSVMHIIKDDDHSIKKEKEKCDRTDIRITGGSCSRTMISSILEKAPIPVEAKLGMACADPENEKGTSSIQFATNREDGSGCSHTTGEASNSQQATNPILHSPNRKDDKASVIEDVKNNKTIIGVSQVPLEKQESTSENDFQPLKGECEHTQVDKLEGVLPKDDDASAEAPPNDNKISSYRAKGEENVMLKVEVTGRKSGDGDDSDESVESCSSTGLFLTRKRPWSYEQKLVCDNKRLKDENHANLESTSLHLRNSSFMSWISNMMKGVCKSNPSETPLALTMRPHHENGGCGQNFDLHEPNQESGSIAGFEGIFKAIYCPSMSARGTGILPLDHKPREGLKELELVNKTCSDSCAPVARGVDNKKLCKKDGISADEKFNLEKYENEEGPSFMLDVSSKNVHADQENSPNATEINSSFNIPSGLGTGGLKSSNSSLKNESDSASASQGKEAKGFCLIDPNKSLNNVSSISGSPESLWIARYFPKDAGNIINPPPCNHGSIAIFEGSTNSGRLLPQRLSYGAFVKDQSIFEDSRNASADDQLDVTSRRMQNYAVNGTGSFGSLKITEHNDQKSKPNLNLIQSSQRFKGSEAIASVFARRLDALRNIMPSEKSGNIPHITTTCFFCGVKGLDLRNCLEITETEIADFVRKVDSFGGAGESSCYCIRCFQLNHWAIACPNTLLRKRSHSDSCSLPDFTKKLNIPRNIDLSNNEEKNLFDINSGECSVRNTGYGGKKPRLSKEMIDDTDCKKELSDNTAKEFKFGLNQTKTASSSMENESKEDQVSALCNFVNGQIPAIPRETLEAIKKLRLSRTDILKWMRSPLSLFHLDGFFLRLRLKNLKGLEEGTGYYVACINGAFGKRSEGTEIPLSVNIGGIKCLVESRFVSNHEFIEDELMAWWCATLKSGSQLPSEADLRMKLEVRKNYGF